MMTMILASFFLGLTLNRAFITPIQAETCGYPGRPAYGKLLETRFLEPVYKPGDSVNYACEKGYYLRGRGSRTCLSNGKWSGSLPLCDAPLQVSGEAVSPGSLKLYPPGLAVDNNPRTCFYSRRAKPREWTLDLLTVRKVISVIITVPFASSEHYFTILLSSGNQSTDNSISNWTRCSSYTGIFATQTQLIVCGSDGVHGRYLHIQDDSKNYEYFGLCEVKVMTEKEKYDCGEAEEPVHSYPIESHRDDHVVYRCKEGFKLEGPTERICQKDGSWSHGQAICKEVTCQQLAAPANGTLEINDPPGNSNKNSNKSNPVQSSEALFTCNPGYKIIGENQLQCLPNGQWNADPPKCLAVDCGLPRNISPESGRFMLLNGTTIYRSMARLECFTNHHGSSERSTLIICQEDSQWSKHYSLCDQQTWILPESFIPSQIEIGTNVKSWKLITTLTIIILFALFMAVILLFALLLKRKYLSVKLITWNEEKQDNVGRIQNGLRQMSKRFGFHRNDVPMIAAMKLPQSSSGTSSSQAVTLPLPGSLSSSIEANEETSGKPSIVRIIGHKKGDTKGNKMMGEEKFGEMMINTRSNAECQDQISRSTEKTGIKDKVEEEDSSNLTSTRATRINGGDEHFKRCNLGQLMATYARVDLTRKRFILPVRGDKRSNIVAKVAEVEASEELETDAVGWDKGRDLGENKLMPGENASKLLPSNLHLGFQASHSHHHIDDTIEPSDSIDLSSFTSKTYHSFTSNC